MYNKTMGSYDEIPEGMKHYINNYGCHFNKKLYEEAVSRMFKEDEEGNEERIKSYSKEQVEIINLKLNQDEIPNLIKKDGIYPAYHMNKTAWLTVLPDMLSDGELFELISLSHELTR